MTVALLLFAGIVALSLYSCRAPQVGLRDGALAPCPESPNCVCSQHTNDQHTNDEGTSNPTTNDGASIQPIAADPPDATWLRLRELLEEWPRHRIETADENYLHVVATTPLFRFKDDVEFLLDRDAGLIHVRSASRVGYSDLGANRRRVERIREALAQ